MSLENALYLWLCGIYSDLAYISSCDRIRLISEIMNDKGLKAINNLIDIINLCLS
jgi:hypothetical protein